MIELVPFSALKTLEQLGENPKEMLGQNFKRALDKSIEVYGMKSALILSPKCDAEHPALSQAWGLDAKHVVVDGSKRWERLQQSGFAWVMVLPGLSSDGSADQFIDAMQAGSKYLKQEIADQVQPGQKIALGMVFEDLCTPTSIKKFVISYDRARARFDEGLSQQLLRDLIAEGEDAAELEALSAMKLAMITDLLQQEQRMSTVVGPDGTIQPAAEPSPERVMAERKAAKAQLRAMIGPFSFSLEGHREFSDLMDALRGTIDTRVLKIMDLAREAGVEEDMELELFVNRAKRIWATHQEDLA